MYGKRLLIIHQGALGDLVTLFPVFQSLRCDYPAIDAVCQKKIGTLAGYLNLIDRDFPVESAVFASLFSDRLHPRLASLFGAYETILLFSSNPDMEAPIKRSARGDVYRISPRPPPAERVHITDYIDDGLRQLGVLTQSSDDIAEDDSRDEKKGGDPLKVWLHPGSGSQKKNWSLSNFLAVAEALKFEGLRPAFLVGPAEQDMIEPLQTYTDAVTWVDDCVRLAELLRTAGGFIGNDSGVTHLSAVMGLHTVAVFGPSDPARWGPRGRSVRIVTPDIDCSPCFEATYPACAGADCLKSISPRKVLSSFYT